VVALLVARVADHGQVLLLVRGVHVLLCLGVWPLCQGRDTLGGQIGVGTRLLLNILDLAYIVVSLVAMVPKMVKPAM
jgi:hypothetical protein